MNVGLGDGASLAREFEAQRPRLLRLAYASTGSLAEAEDCVQEAWLRLQRAAERDPVRDLGAWLTTTVSRLALDALGSARARRERYAGPWLPEPLIERLADPADGANRPGADPADLVTLDESVSMALLVVLEALTPAERTAFLLHDVFGLGYDEIAGVVGRRARSIGSCWTRSRRRALRVTLNGWWRCSIPTSCGGPTAARCARSRAWPRVRGISRRWTRATRSALPGECSRRWSMATPGWSYGTRTACSRCWR